MWMQTFLTGMDATQLAKLDLFALNLLFEFSIEYDIQGLREARQQKKVKTTDDAPIPDDVLNVLGYK